ADDGRLRAGWVQRYGERASGRRLVSRGQRRRRLHPVIRQGLYESVQHWPARERAQPPAHRSEDDVGEGHQPARNQGLARAAHDATRMALIPVVAKTGGHTTARRSTATHSQITLAASRLAPASGVPGEPKARPLPFGRLPWGMWTRSAIAATPAGVSE